MDKTFPTPDAAVPPGIHGRSVGGRGRVVSALPLAILDSEPHAALARQTSAMPALGAQTALEGKVRELEAEVTKLKEQVAAASEKALQLEADTVSLKDAHTEQLAATAASAEKEAKRVAAETNVTWLDYQAQLAEVEARAKEKEQEARLFFVYLWAHFDTDNNGKLDKQEVKQMLKEMDKAVDDAGMDVMMEEIDQDKDGQVSQDELLVWFKQQDEEAHNATAEAIRKRFELAALATKQSVKEAKDEAEAAEKRKQEADAAQRDQERNHEQQADSLVRQLKALKDALKKKGVDPEEVLKKAETPAVVQKKAEAPAVPKRRKKKPYDDLPPPDLETDGGPQHRATITTMFTVQAARGARGKVKWGSLWTEMERPVVRCNP